MPLVTPDDCYEEKRKIKRLKNVPPVTEILRAAEKSPFRFYENLNQMVKKLDVPNFNNKNIINSDLLWIFGLIEGSVPGWNGFMDQISLPAKCHTKSLELHVYHS